MTINPNTHSFDQQVRSSIRAQLKKNNLMKFVLKGIFRMTKHNSLIQIQ